MELDIVIVHCFIILYSAGVAGSIFIYLWTIKIFDVGKMKNGYFIDIDFETDWKDVSKLVKIIYPRQMRIWRHFDAGNTFSMKNQRFFHLPTSLWIFHITKGIPGIFIPVMFVILSPLWPLKILVNIIFYLKNAVIFLGEVSILGIKLFNPFRERTSAVSESPKDFPLSK